MVVVHENYLEHYGILRKSGRYSWGSGATPVERSNTFLSSVSELKKKGLSDVEIAKGFSTAEHPFNVSDLRATRSIAVNELKQDRVNQIVRLSDKGWGYSAIGKRLGVNESSVRSALEASKKDQSQSLAATVSVLRDSVEKKKMLDVGKGVEYHMGISSTKLATAVAVLRDEGYNFYNNIKGPQLGTGKLTTKKVLAHPDVSWGYVQNHQDEIGQITEYSDDGGRSFLGIHPPLSVNSKRIAIRYAEDGGAKADGVIYVRPGVPDLSMGGNLYAQVRVAVDGSHFLKGMAVQKDDLPAGVDLLFNTNKSNTGNKHDVMKELLDDPDNPFGSVIDHQIVVKDKHGVEHNTSAMNIVNDDSNWEKWSKNLPAQMLSKQDEGLAARQLAVTFERRQTELASISSLTNSAVRKKLLTSFADETDSAAVHLKAASIHGQATHVILPIMKIKETEIYAPNYRNGQHVALVRFPHGGPFEIPLLTVNNRNPEARKTLGTSAKTAVGIHYKVAQRLSGADFDGDTVLVIPNNSGDIKSLPALEGLKDFDPQHSYPPYDGMRTITGGRWDAATKTVKFPKDANGVEKLPSGAAKQQEMGKITNLITDMSVQEAPSSDVARAVRHSMVIIDSEKHNLDYKASAKDNGIASLKLKYQRNPETDKAGGASTLFSRTSAEIRVPERRARYVSEGGPIDPTTGRLMYTPTGRNWRDKQGNIHYKTQISKRGAETHDATTLSSGTDIEKVYVAHANKLKELANTARREIVVTPKITKNNSAARVYAPQVHSLNAKLNVALKNAPLERQAQALADGVVKEKRRANPLMTKDDQKKIGFQALNEMRNRVGAVGKERRIQITQEEWNAIQAGAISNKKLTDILNNGDLDNIRSFATPRTKLLMSPAFKARADSMLASGYTQQEVADGLGVSLSTLKVSLEQGK